MFFRVTFDYKPSSNVVNDKSSWKDLNPDDLCKECEELFSEMKDFMDKRGCKLLFDSNEKRFELKPYDELLT